MNERNFSTEKEEQLKDRTRALTAKYFTPMRRIAIEIGVDIDRAYYTVTRWIHGMCKLTDTQLIALDAFLTERGF